MSKELNCAKFCVFFSFLRLLCACLGLIIMSFTGSDDLLPVFGNYDSVQGTIVNCNATNVNCDQFNSEAYHYEDCWTRAVEISWLCDTETCIGTYKGYILDTKLPCEEFPTDKQLIVTVDRYSSVSQNPNNEVLSMKDSQIGIFGFVVYLCLLCVPLDFLVCWYLMVDFLEKYQKRHRHQLEEAFLETTDFTVV